MKKISNQKTSGLKKKKCGNDFRLANKRRLLENSARSLQKITDFTLSCNFSTTSFLKNSTETEKRDGSVQIAKDVSTLKEMESASEKVNSQIVIELENLKNQSCHRACDTSDFYKNSVETEKAESPVQTAEDVSNLKEMELASEKISSQIAIQVKNLENQSCFRTCDDSSIPLLKNSAEFEKKEDSVETAIAENISLNNEMVSASIKMGSQIEIIDGNLRTQSCIHACDDSTSHNNIEIEKKRRFCSRKRNCEQR